MFDKTILIRDEIGILALYYPKGSEEQATDQTRFLTPNEIPLQVGLINRPSGYVFKAHLHSPISRTVIGCPETLIILSGKMEADVYNEHEKFIRSITLESGVFIQIRGGHRFTVIDPVNMIEVKQGPFISGEKIFINPLDHEQAK